MKHGDREHRRGKRGFTLIEALTAVAIVGVLISIAVPVYGEVMENVRLTHDAAQVRILNSVTQVWAATIGVDATQLFPTTTSDADKINLLCQAGYLDSVPVAKSQDASFVFSQATGFWSLSDSVIFHSAFVTMDHLKILTGGWVGSNGVLTQTQNGENRVLFTDSTGSDYTVHVQAAYLLGSSSQSGYGIYYRATDNAKITGYCFQFDPGYSNSFIVREVNNGNETGPIASVSMSSVFGSGFNAKASHVVDITVVGTHHVITVDGVKVLDFQDGTYTQGYVGLRTWNDSRVAFTEATVIKK